MRLFITGASGFVGSAVARQLIARGHTVTGLARSDASAAGLEAAGVSVRRGGLEDLDVLAAAARAADGVIHCGFVHDFANFAASCVIDQRAIETFGAALEGTGRPLLVTSGLAGLALGRPATEEDVPDAAVAAHIPRVSEPAGLAQIARGLKVSVMRLPPSVHGDGDHGFVPALIGIARAKGVSAYVGSGDNLWPAVHREDAARAYVLAIEGGAAHPRYHAIGDQGLPFRQIAEVIGRKLGIPTVSVPKSEASAHFGWMGPFTQFDVPASSALTQGWLGWTPTAAGLLADLEDGTYFSG